MPQTDGFSGAELVSLCQEAAISALERNIDCAQVEHRDFISAFSKVRKGITTEMLEYYNGYANKMF